MRSRGLLPNRNQFQILDDRKLHTFPTGVISLFRTTLLKFGAKGELARLLSMLKHIDLTQLHHVSVQDWLERQIRHPQARQLFLALARLTTYTNAPEMLSASLVFPLLNVQVRYLDGGWQTLVDGLRQIAVASGAKMVTHARVAAIELSEERHTVRLADGTAHQASAVVLAIDPQTASALVVDGTQKELSRWAAQSVPARVACFDVALRRLPRPRHLYVLGIDRSLYYSVHSAWAKLAPEGSALIYTMKYLKPGEPANPETTQQELEALLDMLTLFTPTKTLISMVLRMSRENIRSSARSLANLEFHHADRKLEEVAHEIVATLKKQGVRAMNPVVGFPNSCL